MAYGWHDRGTGYVGFRFNNGAGIQYGWARVTMSGEPDNAFIVRGYAYADPGEPIRAGQRSSDEQAPNQSSLGWLALGAAGLLAWRRRRGHAIQ
jgi:MYXO-CTERM domain-containing protein